MGTEQYEDIIYVSAVLYATKVHLDAHFYEFSLKQSLYSMPKLNHNGKRLKDTRQYWLKFNGLLLIGENVQFAKFLLTNFR
jgi:hypothetical protein